MRIFTVYSVKDFAKHIFYSKLFVSVFQHDRFYFMLIYLFCAPIFGHFAIFIY